jgi:hypothetical protein
LVASPIVDSDQDAGIRIEKLAGATERLVLSAETLGTDPLVEMYVTSCYGCRISIENPIRHHSPPGLWKEKPRFGMHSDAPCCEADRKISLMFGGVRMFGRGIAW